MFEELTRGKQGARTREVLLRFIAPSYTTAERDAISEPKAGMIIFNTTVNKLNVYDGSNWVTT